MIEQDKKELTEFIGECWLDINFFDAEGICKICREGYECHHANRTFDTWEDFGMLKDRIVELKKWLGFELFAMFGKSYNYPRMMFNEWLIDKDRFPALVLKAIKEGVLR